MGGRGSASGVTSNVTNAQKTKMSNITKSLSKRTDIIEPIKFEKLSNGSVSYSYTERKVYAAEKGGKMSSSAKADTVERINVNSGVINQNGLIKKNKPIKKEKILKRGRL